jgi:AraC-like DNA-binding protein
MTPVEKEDVIDQELAWYQNALRGQQVDSDLASVCTATEVIHHWMFSPRLTVDWLREQCHITSNSFPQYFKEAHGVTPSRYIQTHRIRAACLLLQHRELDTFGVALSLGYARYRTFARAFKRLVGMTPSEYRDQPSLQRESIPPRPGTRFRSGGPARSHNEENARRSGSERERS